MTLVSAIVPTKNRSRLLRTALASIRALEGPDLAFELIVVDNGSTDDTDAVAKLFGARLLRTLEPGAAHARNAGLRAASAPYVAFLDDDDVWLPGNIRPHLQLLERHPTFAVVVGQVVLTDEDFSQPGEPYPSDAPDDGSLFKAFLTWIPQLGATVARTTVRETVGYFDANYEGDEDWDWHLRLALRHEIGFVATPCVLFRQRALATVSDQRWARLRNMRRVFINNTRRAGNRGPSVWEATRLFLKHNGQFYGYFAELASRSYEAGDIKTARLAYARAILSSPPHALGHLLRPARPHVDVSF